MKNNKTIFISPLASRSGYGEHAREVGEYLCDWDSSFVVTNWGSNPMNALDNELSVTKKLIERIQPSATSGEYDVCIHLGLPTEFKTLGKYNVGITAGVETNICPLQFIEGCNKMDLVLVPSEFTKETLTNSQYSHEGEQIKCTTPIEVIPESVSENFYYKNQPNSETINSKLDSIQEEFCFLFVGQWITSTSDDGGRKNIKSLIQTFTSTFDADENKPALILKTSGTGFSLIDQVDIEKRIRECVGEINNPPSVYLLHGDLTESEMATLYNHSKIKCHISHTKGEGFGRPLLEASLSGKPVIASKWSGHLDFLPKKHSSLIPGKLTEVGVVNSLFCQGAKWFNVDENRSRELMIDVFSNYDKHLKRAKVLAEINVDKFSKTSIFNIYDNIFNKYIPQKAECVEIKLPTIKKLP
tara:strand:- start:5744 stop:6985 length:1242 start_codon:yes stop_codon:yes gene_type:complete